MHDRSLLGPADVSDAELTRMAADLLGHAHGDVTLLDSCATEFPYDLPAITTAGRYWVSGTARTPAGDEPFRIFVKHVQSWTRSPFFEDVPEEHRGLAAASVPWRTEPLAYASDLGDRLPEGLTMPRALGVFDLDELSTAVWIEESRHPGVAWDVERYRRAAYLIGRLAGSPRVAELANVGEFEWSVHVYYFGRVSMQVLPILRSDEIWRHPAVASTFDADLRRRILEAADRAEAYVAELAAFPHVASHGDASPNNLLPGPTADSFVLIDYGFWLPQPIGYDLGQLLVGDVQIGRRSASELPATEEACLAEYVQGLADEGYDVDLETVRRAHALHVLVFNGLSALPFDQLDSVPPAALETYAANRAELARFSLDLVDATGG
jgi:hypothetical protein